MIKILCRRVECRNTTEGKVGEREKNYTCTNNSVRKSEKEK